MNTLKKLSPWSPLNADNDVQVAERLESLGYGEGEISPSLDEKLEIVRFMRKPLVFPRGVRWSRISHESPSWTDVRDAQQGWRGFNDHIRGDAFADCLRRALSAAVGEDWCPAIMEWDTSPKTITEALRTQIEEEYEDTYEDGRTMGEDVKAVLDMSPLLLVAVHLRIEAVFLEAVKDCPDLMLEGSFEGIQNDLKERYAKMMKVLIEAQLAKTDQASA